MSTDTEATEWADARVVNEPLIRRIVAQIEAEPDTWDQSLWVQPNCKTKRCFAGWALFLEDYTDGVGSPTNKGFKLFHELGVGEDVFFNGVTDKGVPSWDLPYETAGAHVLGIDSYAADRLFSSQAAIRDEDAYEEQEKDDLPTMKRLITRHTGVQFEEPAEA